MNTYSRQLLGSAIVAKSTALLPHPSSTMCWLERGATAQSWRTERLNSLRLLTPNWLSHLPSWNYRGDDPDGYMTAVEVADHLEAYRTSFPAPVLTDTTVVAVKSAGADYVVETTTGPWRCRAVVVASGAARNPKIPALANELPTHLTQLAPIRYRNPGQINSGRVLVVGASVSGAQIADELARAGRSVTLAVGDDVRLPRTYRGMDIHWWTDAIGQLDERCDERDDLVRARRLPSLQLVGSRSRRDLGLNELSDAGVDLVGSLSDSRRARRSSQARFRTCAPAPT